LPRLVKMADGCAQGHVLVELDDGDSRLVDITRIRMLPHNYSRVGEYTFLLAPLSLPLFSSGCFLLLELL
jgi:hypothetical protein